MHWCHEEIAAALAAVPMLGWLAAWVVTRWHRVRACLCPKKTKS